MDGETSVARCQVASARAARALKFGIPAVLYGAGPHSLLEANGHRTDENLQLEDLRKNNEGGRAGAARSARHRATRPGLVAPWPPPSSYAKRSLVETGELRSGDMLDIDELRKWVGKSEQSVEQIAPFPSRALAATLDRNDPPYDAGSELPPLWAWMHFLSVSPLRDAGADGHPKRGGFLPPVPLPRRMWAGSRIEFVQPLRIGDVAT